MFRLRGRLMAATALVALAGWSAGAAGASMEDVRARITAGAVIRSQFTQTRTLPALSRPQVARGRVLISRADGIVWSIEQPSRLAYLMQPDGVSELAADGTRLRRDAGNSVMARIGRILGALLTADAAAIGEDFQVEAEVSGRTWQVTLTPRSTALAQRLKGIRISGGEFVERVQIDAAGDDVTRIEFRDQSSGAELNPDERRLFGAH